VGCIAGALEESYYRGKLYAAGFESADHRADPRLQSRRSPPISYRRGARCGHRWPQIDGKFVSAFIRANKPAASRECHRPFLLRSFLLRVK